MVDSVKGSEVSFKGSEPILYFSPFLMGGYVIQIENHYPDNPVDLSAFLTEFVLSQVGSTMNGGLLL